MPRHVQPFILAASSLEEIEAVRELWSEYWETLGFNGDFQNFAAERMSLPGVYAPPGGRLLLALIDGVTAGTIALRPMDERSCEAKRLYVRPAYRSHGTGRALLHRLIEEARAAGYKEMYGDTLRSMQQAAALYRQIGFRETAAYSANPTPDAIFLKLVL